MKGMVLLGLFLSILMAAAARPGTLLLMSSPSPGAVEESVSYMRVVSIFYILCFAGNTFVGFYRGIGMVQVPVIGTCLHISLRVMFSYLLIRSMGLSGVGLATGIGWGAVVLFQIFLYRKKRLGCPSEQQAADTK